MSIRTVLSKEPVKYVFPQILTYLVIIVMAFSITFFSYSAAQSLLTEQAMQNNLKIVSSISQLIETRLENIDHLIFNISSHYQTNLVLNMTDPLNNHQAYKMREYINLLHSFVYPNELIKYVIIYTGRSGYVYNDLSARTLGDYYSTLYSGTDYSIEDWKKLLSGEIVEKLQSEQIINIQGIPVRVIPYVQSLPIGSVRQSLGSMCIYLDWEKLIAGFVDEGNFESYYMLDRNGKLITCFDTESAEPIELPDEPKGCFRYQNGGEKKNITYYRSEKGFSFVSVSNYNMDISNISYLRTVFLASLFAGLTATLLLSILFSYRNGKPIRMISDVLSKATRHPESLETDPRPLHEWVEDIVKDNSDLRNTLQTQRQELQTSYLMRLISGTYASDQELSTYANHLGLLTADVLYSVIVLQIDIGKTSEKDASFARLYLNKAKIRHYLESCMIRVYILDTGMDELSLLMQIPLEEEHHFAQTTEEMMNQINLYLGESDVRVFAGAGTLRKSISQIYRSRQEAQIALSQHFFRSNSYVNWFSHLQSLEQMYYFSSDIQQRLIISTRGGDIITLRKIIKELYQENFENRKLSSVMLVSFIRELEATLLKTSYEIYADDKEQREKIKTFILHRPQRIMTISETMRNLTDLMIEVCEYANSRKASHNDKKKEEVLDFVKNNYDRPDLSLSLVAEKFNLNDSYLSSFFKEQTGQNYAAYVEQLRLEHACDMLKGENNIIDQLAQQIGYTNAQSFRRAFKRRYGITPSQYREKIGLSTSKQAALKEE